MAVGYLIVQARTAQDAIPIAGAHIQVLDDEGGSVYELISDESGETQKVPLETVDKSLSLDSNYSGTPYLRYDITAQAEGYKSFHIIGVPIFDGETAIQTLAFEPLQASAARSVPPVTEITMGDFAVDIPEWRSQEGPAIRPYVLRYVAIPNPITVHLGSPSSYASNVRVSFSDYVKNVASSEIYPTWPDASLRANIYAIITFALNRVFTEWYRSQGYSFDITNSTAYDQYFVYGRTIYESISRIVDEIFNEYVRRAGQNAPYFTSFCNGTNVVCAGLSQWGTVSLANSGYTPLQILRYYYPNDVEIAETNVITDVLSSYPGTALRVGSSGLDVETIQTYLGRIRRNYPAIPVITDAAGTFGESTRAAVSKFQSIFNLQVDGIVGKATWYKLSSLYAAVTRLAELDSEGTSLGIGTVPPSSVLRQGSRGADVVTLQYILSAIAEFYPSIPVISQDGIFGSMTRQAVVAYQRMMNLSPDGIVGNATWRSLYETYLGIVENVPPPATNPGTFEYTVRSGDTLWLLSRRFGTTVDEIKRLNGLSSDLLNIGQVLLIPEA
ncbi:MAG: peptidoglycan-binding protein [Butyrivibrio sp.]|nr:peptidoglycan-binding protein [Butyrivibrio sp.]